MRTLEPLIRPAKTSDRQLVSALLTSAAHRHVHLDWTTAIDLIGEPLFLLAVQDDLPIACLAAPPDPLALAWIRVFAIAPEKVQEVLWDALWADLEGRAQTSGVSTIYSLVVQPWFEPLLLRTEFEQVNEVIFYEWAGSAGVLGSGGDYTIRRIRSADLQAVTEVDRQSFAPAWQHSLKTLAAALKLSTYATVCEIDDQLIGYQVTTASALGAHLARLAVLPSYRRKGVGRTLVIDMLKHVVRRGFNRVTVNTQADNLGSQELYTKLGFQITGQRYPMYAFHIDPHQAAA